MADHITYSSTSGYNTSIKLPTTSSRFVRSSDQINLRICERRNLHGLRDFTTQRNQTMTQLKQEIARSLGAYQSLDKLFLEKYDYDVKGWERIYNQYSNWSINSYDLSDNSVLNLDYEDRSIPLHDYSSYSLPVSSINASITFKLCNKSMDMTDYTFLVVTSSSTIRDLRKKVYAQWGKPSQNHPIFVRIDDYWTKFDTTHDNERITDLSIKEYMFVSPDVDENISDEKYTNGLCGIANFGSTCFMNSVFQCLSNTPEFTDKILCLNDEINAPIIGEYKKLIKKIWSGRNRDVEPRELLYNIESQLPRYTTYRQQDAQEFMHHFLHLIHDEFSSKETIITELFYGQIRSSVTCLECQHIEKTKEKISSLPLPISTYDQKFVRYIKSDGEQRFVSIQIDSSIKYMDELIKCFIDQHDKTLAQDRILPVQLVNHRITKEYSKYETLRYIDDEEIAFIERLPITSREKYVWCHFADSINHKQFRPSVALIVPEYNCRYVNLEDQIDQLFAHFCSLTGVPLYDISIYWENFYGDEHQIKIETDANETLFDIKAIKIKMDTKYIDIYKQQYNFNHLNDKSSLLGLIDDFFEEEQIHGNYQCTKCSKSTKALKKSQLCLPLPRVLIIQLKRFTFNQYSNDKINTFIPYPLTDLDLSKYIFKDKSSKLSSTKYDLVAVSNHTGTLNSGHYTTYAKNKNDKQWYLFDDRYVRKIENEQEVITKNAYILIYIQKDSS